MEGTCANAQRPESVAANTGWNKQKLVQNARSVSFGRLPIPSESTGCTEWIDNMLGAQRPYFRTHVNPKAPAENGTVHKTTITAASWGYHESLRRSVDGRPHDRFFIWRRCR
jgi:hypothetical protein